MRIVRHMAAALGVAAVLGAAGSADADARRPNIVLVVTDDQRADAADKMPVVRNRLAAKGVTFANAFVTNPLCCPSRAAILTGRSSGGTAVWSNASPFGSWASFRASGAEARTLAVVLRRAGYRTGLFGKYLNGYKGPAIPPGWTHWNSFSAGWHYFDYVLNVNGRAVRYGRSAGDYSTDVLARRAAAFVRTSRRPFFLVFSPAAAHWDATPAPRHANRPLRLAPFRPPSVRERDLRDKPRYVRRYARPLLPRGRRFRERQYRSLLAVDEAVDRILNAVSRSGELRRTVVVFTSDNGVMWGEHRMQAARKAVPYESSIRVPLVVRYDRLVPRRRTERRLVANIDIAPTLARLAGTRLPADGRSLVSFLRDRRPPRGWRDEILIESMGGEYPADPIPTYCGVRGERYVYVLYATDEEELYDLRNDPFQLENLAKTAEAADEKDALRERMRRLCFPPPPGFAPAKLCTVRGTQRGDRLRGGPGEDAVCLRGGRDAVATGPGADTIYAAARSVASLSRLTFSPPSTGGLGSRIETGTGNDRILVLNGRRDTVSCGRGRDQVIGDRFDVVARDCEQRHRAPRLFARRSERWAAASER